MQWGIDGRKKNQRIGKCRIVNIFSLSVIMHIPHFKKKNEIGEKVLFRLLSLD